MFVRRRPSSLVFSLAVTLLTGALTACSSGSSGGSSAGGPAGPGDKPDGTISCDQVITQAAIDRFNATQSVENVAGVRGYGFSSCQSHQDVNGQTSTQQVQGFAGLYVIPSMTLTAKTQTDGSSFDIFVETKALDDTSVTATAEAFQPFVNGRRVEAEVSEISYASFTLGTLPNWGGGVRSLHLADGTEATVIRFPAPRGLESRYREALDSYANGAAAVQLEASSSHDEGATLLADFKRTDKVTIGKFHRVSGLDLLTERWNRIARLGSLGVSHAELPYTWMTSAKQWWPDLKISPATAQTQFREAIALSNTQWNPRRMPGVIDRSNLLTSLQFLLLVDPANAANKYAHALQILAPLFNGSNDDYYDEVVDLVEVHPLTLDQETFVVNLATQFKTRMYGGDAWRTAKRLASSTHYDQAKVTTILAAYQWISDVRGQNALDTAEEWVTKNDLTEATLAQAKSFYKFIYEKTYSSSSAFDRSVALVIVGKATSDQTALFQEVFTWINGVTYSSTTAMEKADRYVTQAKLTRTQVEDLKTVYTWVNGAFYSTTTALSKAELYIIDSHLSRADVTNLQDVFTWINGAFYSTTTAIDKAEAYVLKARLGTDELKRLKDVFTWINGAFYSTTTAIKKAELYVVDKKITQAQYEKLKSVYDADMRTSYSTTHALAKAEKEVLGL